MVRGSIVNLDFFNSYTLVRIYKVLPTFLLKKAEFIAKKLPSQNHNSILVNNVLQFFNIFQSKIVGNTVSVINYSFLVYLKFDVIGSGC